MNKCLFCKTEGKNKLGQYYCDRCLTLAKICGEAVSIWDIVDMLYTNCPDCGESDILSVNLNEEDLLVECDNCQKISIIPFKKYNIRQYIKTGINCYLEQQRFEEDIY